MYVVYVIRTERNEECRQNFLSFEIAMKRLEYNIKINFRDMKCENGK